MGVVFSIGDIGSALGPSFALGLIPVLSLGNVYQICAGLYFLVGIFAVWQVFAEKRSMNLFCHKDRKVEEERKGSKTK